MISLENLEKRLATCTLPETISLSIGETITDVPYMVKNHITILKSNPGNRTFLPYYLRLLKLYKKISVS